MSLRFASYHSMSWLVGIMDTALPGTSAIFSKKHRTSNGNEDDVAERASNACQVGFNFVAYTRIHKLLETY
jgi:hypothetical protein